MANLGRQSNYWVGSAPAAPDMPELGALMGGRHYLSEFLDLGLGGVISSLFLFSFFLILRTLLRKQWLTIAVFMILVGAMAFTQGGNQLPIVVANLLGISVILLLLVRYGFLALVASMLAGLVGQLVPFPSDISAWTFSRALIPVIVALVLLAYAFLTSVGIGASERNR